MKKELTEASEALMVALTKMDEVYFTYIKAVSEARLAAENLEKVTRDIISQPMISVVDCEIDS